MSKNNNKSDDKDFVKRHFDKLAATRASWIKKSKGFYLEDIRAMQELIPSGAKILEIGCGNGNLIGSLKPTYGVGIDISSEMIIEAKAKYKDLNFIVADIESSDSIDSLDEFFDFIILSDTIGYLSDIESTLEKLHKLCNADTRIIVAYYSPFWEPILNVAAWFKLKMPELPKALLNETDISSLLDSAGFETVKNQKKIIFPFIFFGIGRILNRFISCMPILSYLCIRSYVISRSLKAVSLDLPTSASVIIP